jgi:hypothetical protein
MNSLTRRERTDRLRALSLTDILRALDARPDPGDPAKWHTPRGVLSVRGAKFFNWSESAGGGGAIDLAMHLRGLGFQEALEWLARRLASPPPCAPTAPSCGARPLVLPAPVVDALPAVIRYLSGQRRLPLAHIQPLVDSGDLYADCNRNAVFLLRNASCAPVGAELRGTGPEPWRAMAPGSRKDNGYFALGPPDPHAIVLCESAIDALSCRTLDPERLCLSTAGARPSPAWLPTLLARGLPTYCGFDNDPTGDRMARAIIDRHPAVQRLRPPCHDWNDALPARA